MKHEITQFIFGEKGKKGWIIDHKDAPAAISVTPNEGDFLVHMSNTPQGIAIPGSSVVSIELTLDDEGFYLFVNYTCDKESQTKHKQRFLIGQSRNAQLINEARHFVQSLNQAFWEKQ